MNLYSGLFESMLDCCGRTWLRRGPVYTLAMMALYAVVSLNILSVINLLWTLGVLNNPYRSHGTLHPRHYLYALLCLVFIANTLLARLQFNADHGNLRPARAASAAAAPAYVLASTALFLVSLVLELR